MTAPPRRTTAALPNAPATRRAIDAWPGLVFLLPDWIRGEGRGPTRYNPRRPAMMRAVCTTVVMILSLAAAIAGQAGSGRISGVLTGARGPIPNAEVRIKNTATDQVIVATTSPAGAFSVPVPAGSYDVFSSTVGYAVLARRGVTVAPGATVRVDAALADNPNAGTPGEIFFLYARADRKPPAGPAPRTRDGKPDLGGV